MIYTVCCMSRLELGEFKMVHCSKRKLPKLHGMLWNCGKDRAAFRYKQTMSSYYVYHLRFYHTLCKINTCAPPPDTKLQLSIRRLTLDPCNKRCDTLSSCFISCHCIILIHIVSAFGLSYVNLNCETRHIVGSIQWSPIPPAVHMDAPCRARRCFHSPKTASGRGCRPRWRDRSGFRQRFLRFLPSGYD